MALLGLVAPAGNGKTKAAKYLAKAYGMKRLHAGDPVKKAVRAAYGLSKADVTDDNLKDSPNHAQLGGLKPRDVLDAHGGAVMNTSPRATAMQLHKRIMKAQAKGQHVVVEGVRQPAEAALIKSMGGHLIGVDGGKAPADDKQMEQSAASIVTDHMVSATAEGGKAKKAAMRAGLDAVMAKCMGY